jgi:CubicO group peptidase (beta-lactamase class C family)
MSSCPRIARAGLSLVCMAVLISAAASAASAASASSVSKSVETPPPLEERLDQLLAAQLPADEPGCSLALALRDETPIRRGYGMASLEHALPITADTRFHAASITKQFTAFSIGLLAHDGALSLEDSVRKHLPELPDYTQPITLQHLIHHTGGVREQGHLLLLSGWRWQDLFTQADALEVISAQRAANHPAGEEVVYGNSAYTLLAEVVRRVSGQTLPAFAQARIFAPLGMGDTVIRQDAGEVLSGLAPAYRKDAEGWHVSVPQFAHFGSSNLITTPSDLLIWQRNLLSGALGGESLAQWMRRSGRLNDGTELGYGGGLRLGQHRGVTLLGHDGMDAGYRANSLLFPEHELRLALLCNAATVDANQLALQIAEVALNLPPPATTIEPGPTSQADLADFSGAYWSRQTDEIVRIGIQDGRLQAVGDSRPLLPLSAGLFQPQESDHQWRFARGGDGGDAKDEVELRILDYWPVPRVFERLREPLPTREEQAQLTGHYRNDELGQELQVSMVGDELVLSSGRKFSFEMIPVGGDHFVAGFGSVSFMRSEAGAPHSLQFTTRRLRRLTWNRIASP